MRTKNADGSITEECRVCGGSEYVRNKDTNLSEKCGHCNGTGVVLVAPAGHIVTDESPEVVHHDVPFGGGVALHKHVLTIPELAKTEPPLEFQVNRVPEQPTEHVTPPFPTSSFPQETHGVMQTSEHEVIAPSSNNGPVLEDGVVLNADRLPIVEDPRDVPATVKGWKAKK